MLDRVIGSWVHPSSLQFVLTKVVLTKRLASHETDILS